jgi:hypothetical protein
MIINKDGTVEYAERETNPGQVTVRQPRPNGLCDDAHFEQVSSADAVLAKL